MIEHEPIAERRLVMAWSIGKSCQEFAPGRFVRTEHRVQIAANHSVSRRQCLQERPGLTPPRTVSEQSVQPAEPVFKMRGDDEERLGADADRGGDGAAWLPFAR